MVSRKKLKEHITKLNNSPNVFIAANKTGNVYEPNPVRRNKVN